MGERFEKLANNGPITGMLIEHDLGRLYILNLEEALKEYKEGNDEKRLDIIANAISYSDLLYRHTEKENTALYKLAENILPTESKNRVDEKCKEVEIKANRERIQEKYLNILKELENKVN